MGGPIAECVNMIYRLDTHIDTCSVLKGHTLEFNGIYMSACLVVQAAQSRTMIGTSRGDQG